MTSEPAVNLATKSDDEIKNWIVNHENQGKTDTPLYRMLVEERARRTGKGLEPNTSIRYLADAAKSGRFTTYGELAEANSVPWSKARHAMNGASGHLDQLLDICHARGLPLLPSICVNKEGVQTGTLGPDALAGFAKGAERLGFEFQDAVKFLRECQDACFEWGDTNSDRID